MSYIQEAFRQVLVEPQESESWYVCLVSRCQAYGGPEEGGWWYTINELHAWQEFPSYELADSAREKIEALAEELSLHARRQHGDHCLESLAWLEARGLEPDYLPEPDGPEEYRVVVRDSIPQYTNERPHYC